MSLATLRFRKRVRRVVRDLPYLHTAAYARELGAHASTVLYHLTALERDGVIESCVCRDTARMDGLRGRPRYWGPPGWSSAT